jgi:hypothetical protein
MDLFTVNRTHCPANKPSFLRFWTFTIVNFADRLQLKIKLKIILKTTNDSFSLHFVLKQLL